jgi:PAS domain S-box-containing protein
VVRPPGEPPPETELEEFFNLSIDPMSIIGLDGEFKRVNASFVRLLGYSRSELFSRTALDLVHPEDVEPARQALAQLAEGHDQVGFEARMICADGGVRSFEWNTRSMPERGVVYTVGRDTGERRRVEAELREAQRLLEASRDELRALADEQAALRRVATLVAQDAPSSELFGAVAGEVGVLLGADLGGMIRYEEDGTVTSVATWAAVGEHPPVPERWQIEPGDPAWMILETRAATRVEDWASVPGPFAEAVRNNFGVSSSVGCPIVAEGRLWGALAVHSKQSRPLPADTESRIAQFTDLVGTAIANAQSRAEVGRLAEEQAALRRVATLVAQGVPPDALFSAVCEEVEAIAGSDGSALLRFETDGTVTLMGTHAGGHRVGARLEASPDFVVGKVYRTGRAARFDTDDPAAPGMPEVVRTQRICSGLASPIVVEGELWGAITTATRNRPLAAGMEHRLADFTELVATAIANAESRARADRLADEQTTLRRLATLVAQEAPFEAVFAKVAEAVAKTFGDVDSALWRSDGDRTATAVAVRAPSGTRGVRVGTRLTLDGDSVIARALRDGRPHRIDDFSQIAGSVAERARELGMRSAVGCPIVVGARTWGAMTVATFGAEPFAPETETRVARFSDLVATAIGNAESRAEVERLAAEQAALRRVATLVAEGASPSAVMDAVAAEMERALGADAAMLLRYEPGEEATVVAGRVPHARGLSPGTRVRLEGENVSAMVRRTGRPARIGNYERARGPTADLARTVAGTVSAAVGSPIVVDGRLWGVIIASWGGERSPPEDTEERMTKFAQMLDTAIANADSRDQLISSRARLLSAGDEARRRVVRDLHDGAQQRLVHTIVTLKLARQALENDRAEAGSLVDEALEQAQQGNTELRELAHGILPSALTRGGLRAGVESVIERLDLPVDADVPAARFPSEIEASAYFIVGEALTNVVKHAHAQRVEVRARVREGMLRIEVRDDGVGGADAQGRGLQGLADRASALGGRLEVESPDAGGTRLTAVLPVPP